MLHPVVSTVNKTVQDTEDNEGPGAVDVDIINQAEHREIQASGIENHRGTQWPCEYSTAAPLYLTGRICYATRPLKELEQARTRP